MINVPACLFFDGSQGLYPLLHRYKFTVEENTPLDREVALDPELLGSVFENLLAAYNPETRQIARKKTGSYYTPRQVVDYMVRESLTEAIAARTSPEDGDSEFWRDRILYLLDHSAAMADAHELFEESERRSIVSAIAELRTIDPAVGSGAFPMGILQTLTLGLRRLDGDNELWEEVQKQRAKERVGDALDIDDQQARDEALKEISAVFENYRKTDFGRKLYLIQNAIYGVDIQPIACQIAKLRFFISLTIEQEVTSDSATNFGIKPLPNLETKFIAADSLLNAGEQRRIAEEGFRDIVDSLKLNRERHFNATSTTDKRDCREKDERIRNQLARSLASAGIGDDYIEKTAEWDPYDQNNVAEWFDPEYMFGVERFDVVIGNPPYVQLQRNDGELRKKYEGVGYEVLAPKGDAYLLFFERGMKLTCQDDGVLAYITSNSWLKADYGSLLREYFSEQHTAVRLVELGKDVFENAIVDSAVLVVRNGMHQSTQCRALDTDQTPDVVFPPPDKDWGVLKQGGRKPWMVLSSIESSILAKIEAAGKQLKYWDISIYRGIVKGYNPAFFVDQETRDRLVANDPKSTDILKPVLRGRDIKRYYFNWADLWLIATLPSWNLNIDDYPAVRDYLLQFGEKRLAQEGLMLPDGSKSRSKTSYKWFELQSTCAYYALFSDHKLFWRDMSSFGRFVHSKEEIYINDKAFMMSGKHLMFLCGILNSSLITWFVSKVGLTTGMGLPQWKKYVVQSIPVPSPEHVEDTITNLVEELHNSNNQDEDLYRELDDLVLSLYGLTELEKATLLSTAIHH